LEESNPDVLSIVLLKKSGKIERISLYSSPKVIKKWKDTLFDELNKSKTEVLLH